MSVYEALVRLNLTCYLYSAVHFEIHWVKLQTWLMTGGRREERNQLTSGNLNNLFCLVVQLKAGIYVCGEHGRLTVFL